MVSESVHLEHGRYSAEISPVGAALIQLRLDGENYCPPRNAADLVARYHGSVIAPWANRVRDGRYSFRGDSYQVETNESQLNNSLHGLSATVKWETVEVTPTACTFTAITGDTHGYPWRIQLQAGYSLDDAGLRLTFVATNFSDSAAPFCWAFHPYFQLPSADASTWQLSAELDKFIEVDERLLPVARSQVSGAMDFRNGSACCFPGLDHAFSFAADVAPKVTLGSPQSKTVSIESDPGTRWLQLHHPTGFPRTIVIEPQSSPPDAMNSGVGLITLDPGVPLDAWVQISIS